MMKLLLISPNVEFLPDPIFPLGLAYIAAALKRQGIDHRILAMLPTAVVCMVGIRIFPGTRLFEMAGKEGSIQAG